MKIYLNNLKPHMYVNYIANKSDKDLGHKTIQNEVWILTADGKYKITDNNYFKYKLNDISSEIKKLYIDDITAFCETSYFTKKYAVYNIPIQHHKIMIQKYIYDRDPSISLVIEKINNKISDIYFWTKKDSDDNDVKSTIASFLSLLT